MAYIPDLSVRKDSWAVARTVSEDSGFAHSDSALLRCLTKAVTIPAHLSEETSAAPSRNSHKINAIFVAIDNNNLEAVNGLLLLLTARDHRHKQVPIYKATGDNPLHYAARHGAERIFGVLVGVFHAHINSWNDRRETPLMLAASVDDPQHAGIVRAIMALTPATKTKNNVKKTTKIVLVDVAGRNCEQDTALDIAARNGNVRIIRELLLYERSANQHTMLHFSLIMSALRIAMETRQTPIAELILQMLNEKTLKQCVDAVRLMMLSRANSSNSNVSADVASTQNSTFYHDLWILLQNQLKFRQQLTKTEEQESNFTSPKWHSKADFRLITRRIRSLTRRFQLNRSSVDDDDDDDDELCDGDFVFIHSGRRHNYTLPIPDGVRELPSSQLDIGKAIGAGSYGTVFAATLNGQPVAVKKLSQNSEMLSDRQVWQATLREARVHAQISHPGIVGFYGIAYDASRHVSLVMQLVENCCDMETLFVAPARQAAAGAAMSTTTLRRQQLEEADELLFCSQQQQIERRIPVGNATFVDKLEIAAQVAEAVRYLHQVKGFVHGDIKPSNVLLTEQFKRKSSSTTTDGAMETVRFYHAFLADFGITRVASFDDVSVIDMEEITTSSSRKLHQQTSSKQHDRPQKGARGYWSPEVFMGDCLSYEQSSDVWALCITLLEMFISAPAYGANAGLPCILAIFLNKLPLSSLGHVHNDQVKAILSKGLAYNVPLRSNSAQIADELRQLVVNRRRQRHAISSIKQN